MNIKNRLHILTVALGLATALIQAGCGGGSTSSVPSTGPTPRSGILVDAPVTGVAYTTSSGITGTTGANGSYNFNAGDTVEFKLGSLVLGNVTATGIVTPTELAAGNSNKLTNLLVLFQSLDADGNPGNGISIPAPAAAAVTTAIDLTVATASLNTAALQTAMDAGAIVTPIVSAANAEANYLAQSMTLLSSNIWVGQPAANSVGATILFRFAANGEYLQGQADADDLIHNTTAGVEYGTASPSLSDVSGFSLAATPTVDTNLEAGLSHLLLCDRFRTVGDSIVFSEDTTTPTTCANGSITATFSKAENNPAGITGVWALDSTAIKTQHFAFFSNGKFLMVDPWGDTAVNSCGGPGVEAGSYTYDATAKILKVSAFTYDTNGCAGFSQTSAVTNAGMSFTLSSDGNTITADAGGAFPFTLYRVSN